MGGRLAHGYLNDPAWIQRLQRLLVLGSYHGVYANGDDFPVFLDLAVDR